jgi:CHAT domain-containing protein
LSTTSIEISLPLGRWIVPQALEPYSQINLYESTHHALIEPACQEANQIMSSSRPLKSEDDPRLSSSRFHDFVDDFLREWKRELEKKHQEAMDEVEKKHQETINELEKKHEEAINEVEKNHEETIIEIAKEADRQIRKATIKERKENEKLENIIQQMTEQWEREREEWEMAESISKDLLLTEYFCCT